MTDTNANSEGLDALVRAVDRNTPLSVVRCEQAGRAPFANGRLIRLTDTELQVEDLRIIGRDVRFLGGQKLDAYFTLEGSTYAFRTEVLVAQLPVRLNQIYVVKGLTLKRPTTVEIGQRRNAYRVSLAGAEPRATAMLWRLRDAAPDEDANPRQAPPPPEIEEVFAAASARQCDLVGWVADASDRGLGLIIEGHGAAKLRIFEVVALSLDLPGHDSQLVFPAEVRQVREVRPRVYKVGFTIAIAEMPRDLQSRMRKLNEYLSQVQRDELRRQKSA